MGRIQGVKHLGVALDGGEQDLVAVDGGQQMLHVGRPPSQLAAAGGAGAYLVRSIFIQKGMTKVGRADSDWQ